MRIAIVNLTSGGLSGGYRKYLNEIVPRLRAHGAVSHLSVFVPAVAAGLLADNSGIEVWPAGAGRTGERELRARVIASRPDVVFIPTARWMQFGDTPVISMVRNMEPLERPLAGNPPAEVIRNLVRAFVAYRACRQSHRVIAVSGHVRRYLLEKWRLSPQRVGMVPHGVSTVALDAMPPRPSVFEGVDIENTVVTAGSIRPARGLEDLVEAMAIARDRGVPVKGVIAGEVDAIGEHYARHIRALIADRKLTAEILWTGRLAAPALSWAYRNARAFVMTSRCEACPNTALEAMAHGAYCISTDHPPMPEFFLDGARYYAARNATSLAHRLAELHASSADDRERAQDAARTRAAMFTWEKTVEGTLAELGSAAHPDDAPR